jgi:hypothetical protein
MSIKYTIIGINLFIFVIAPFLPNIVYTHFVETYAGITLLLLASLYSVTFGYLATVSVFIGIASLYSESHARKARNVKGFAKASNTNEFENQIQPAPELVPNEVHPEIEQPDSEVIKSVPDNDESDNMFKSIDDSINEKTNLPTISNAKDAESTYLKDNLAESELK